VRREGHCSIGATTPATDYYLAEGATGYQTGFTTFVLVQNPQNTPTNVMLTYQTQKGEVPGPIFDMPPNSRKTVRVNDRVPPDTDVSTKVHGSQPIVAERSMYWCTYPGTGLAMHDSVGVDAPHSNWYMSDGGAQTMPEGKETWTLVQNPGPTPVEVKISYLKNRDGGAITLTATVPAASRRTFSMGDVVMKQDASVAVECITPGGKVICERSMYYYQQGTYTGRWAGTDTIGGYTDN
jgi:hypothetical protein